MGTAAVQRYCCLILYREVGYENCHLFHVWMMVALGNRLSCTPLGHFYHHGQKPPLVARWGLTPPPSVVEKSLTSTRLGRGGGGGRGGGCVDRGNLHHHLSILTHNSVPLERGPLCLPPRKTNHVTERSPKMLLFWAGKYICPHFQFCLSAGVCLFDCFILWQLGTKVFLFCLFLQLFLQFNKSNTKLKGVRKAREGAVHSITLLIGNTALECCGRAPNQEFQMPEASSFPIRLEVSLDNQ